MSVQTKFKKASISILQRFEIENNKKTLFVSVAELTEDYGYNICLKK